MEVEADWRDSKKAHECLAHLCLTEKMADVIFGFPDSPVKLHAHKFVLSMRSAVFEAMFYGPMAEKTPEITIKDTDPETFQLFLRYLYLDTTDLETSTLLSCLYLGRKYCVEGFALACLAFLETSVSPENICVIYEQACQVDMPDLHTKCLKLMAAQAEPILLSDKFLDISNKTLVAFLNCDDLNANEKCLFNAAVRWAKHQCTKCEEVDSPENIRKYIGDALYSIRLPTLPIKIFADVVGPSQILTPEEELNVYRYMGTNSNIKSESTGTFGGFGFANVDVKNDSKENVGRFNPNERKPNIAEIKLCNTSKGSSFTTNEYTIIELSIYTASRLKLLTVSDTNFCYGVKCVNVNSKELKENEWFSQDDKLVFIGGTMLAGGRNTVAVITKSCGYYVSNARSDETFDVLGMRMSVNYGQSTGRKMTFGK